MTNKNGLSAGSRRLGRVLDGDPDTPELQGLLEMDASGDISLSIFCRSSENEAHRWWSGSAMYSDDPERTRFRYSSPHHLVFKDHLGSVTLLSCTTTKFTGNAFDGIGTVKARYIVFGSTNDEQMGAVGDLRAEVSGLPEWLGHAPFTTSTVKDERGLVQEATVTAPKVDPILLGSRNGAELELRPGWTSTVRQNAVLTSQLHVQSMSSTLRTWSSALELPQAARDLLSLSQWRREEITSLAARFHRVPIDADPIARHHLTRWMPVINANETDPDRIAATRPRHLIHFSDVGPNGVMAWLALRDHFARALDPITSMLRLEGATVEVLMAQVGIGLEGLGYLIATEDDKLSRTKANEQSFAARLTRIREDVKDAIPLDLSSWPESAATAYNSVKHANKTRLDIIAVAEPWRLSTLVARVWVASRLGVPTEVLRERVGEDAQSGELLTLPDPANL